MTNHGGKREGAGNKEGSVRPNFYKFVDQDEVREFMDWVKKNYKKNPRLAIWYGEHLFGKATQPVSGENGEPLTFVITKFAKCGHCDKDKLSTDKIS